MDLWLRPERTPRARPFGDGRLSALSPMLETWRHRSPPADQGHRHSPRRLWPPAASWQRRGRFSLPGGFDLAHYLLGRAVAPPGAVPVGTPTSGILAQPLSAPGGTPDLVDFNKTWQLPLTMDAAVEYLKRARRP